MTITHGVEKGPTPIGNMKSLEAIAKEINDRARKLAEAKRKQEAEVKERAQKLTKDW